MATLQELSWYKVINILIVLKRKRDLNAYSEVLYVLNRLKNRNNITVTGTLVGSRAIRTCKSVRKPVYQWLRACDEAHIKICRKRHLKLIHEYTFEYFKDSAIAAILKLIEEEDSICRATFYYNNKFFYLGNHIGLIENVIN